MAKLENHVPNACHDRDQQKAGTDPVESGSYSLQSYLDFSVSVWQNMFGLEYVNDIVEVVCSQAACLRNQSPGSAFWQRAGPMSWQQKALMKLA